MPDNVTVDGSQPSQDTKPEATTQREAKTQEVTRRPSVVVRKTAVAARNSALNKRRKRFTRKKKRRAKKKPKVPKEIPKRARDFPFELDEFSTSEALNELKFTLLVALCEKRNISVRQFVDDKPKPKSKSQQISDEQEPTGDQAAQNTGASSQPNTTNESDNDPEAEDSDDNPLLDFDDKQVLVDRILEWRASRAQMRKEARKFQKLMRRRQQKLNSAERDALRPKVYKRVCRKCGIVWQSEEVEGEFGPFELRYAAKNCLHCRYPHRFKAKPPPQSPVEQRMQRIRKMSVAQLTKEMDSLGLSTSQRPATSPTVYSPKYGSSDSFRPPPSREALISRLSRHQRKTLGLTKAGVPPGRRKKPRPAKTRVLTQGISLYAFTGNAMRSDWDRLEQRAQQLLSRSSSRPKTIQEYQDEFVAQHIELEAKREPNRE